MGTFDLVGTFDLASPAVVSVVRRSFAQGDTDSLLGVTNQSYRQVHIAPIVVENVAPSLAKNVKRFGSFACLSCSQNKAGKAGAPTRHLVVGHSAYDRE